MIFCAVNRRFKPYCINKLFTMKTKLFLLSIVVAGVFYSYSSAQNLETYFDKNYLEQLKDNDPNEFQFLKNALERGMYISDIPELKSKEIVFNGEISLDLSESHNVFSLGKVIEENYQYYRIIGTNKMVVIQPKAFIYPQ